MYYRNSGYVDVARLVRSRRSEGFCDRTMLSIGMILIAVAAFFLILEISRLLSGF